jgi:hypothetical protein
MTRATPRTTVVLSDGIVRTLRYPLGALKEAREEFGGSVLRGDTLGALDETNVGKLIWYGLRADQPDMTVEEVESLIDWDMLPYVFEAYAKALGGSMPEKKESRPEESRAATAETETSTGSGSGPSLDTTLDSQNASSGGSPSASSLLLPSATKTA